MSQQKCEACNGRGLKSETERCPVCHGYGLLVAIPIPEYEKLKRDAERGGSYEILQETKRAIDRLAREFGEDS